MKSLLVAILVAIFALNHRFIFRRKFPVPPFDHGVILISGTSSGIGRATCSWLAERYNQTTIYCGVRKEKDATGHPFDLPNVQSVQLDITQQHQVDDVMKQIQATGKPLIGLINNAGIADAQAFEFIGVQRLRQVLEVNVVGTYRLTQAALPMIRQAQGRIVLVGSISALTPAIPLWSAYIASKCALEAFGDALRMEMGPLGVSVSLIEPGFIETGMVNAEADSISAAMSLSQIEEEPDEVRIYPHLMDGTYLGNMKEVSLHTGNVEETCATMEDAIFGQYPETRYVTSRIGPFPGWFHVRLLKALPDRVVDWCVAHLEFYAWLANARAKLERWLAAS